MILSILKYHKTSKHNMPNTMIWMIEMMMGWIHWMIGVLFIKCTPKTLIKQSKTQNTFSLAIYSSPQPSRPWNNKETSQEFLPCKRKSFLHSIFEKNGCKVGQLQFFYSQSQHWISWIHQSKMTLNVKDNNIFTPKKRKEKKKKRSILLLDNTQQKGPTNHMAIILI